MRQGICLLILFIVLTAALMPRSGDTLKAQSGERCFEETGYCIYGRMRTFWEENGGLPVFGLPISPAQEELVHGHSFMVQWFERHRLEWHPEYLFPNDVLVSRLGVDYIEQQGYSWYIFPKGQATPGCVFFAETGHSLCEPFLSYWNTHGIEQDGQGGKTHTESLALFGMPISEPYPEVARDGTVHTVQWFERARFEHYPENPAGYQVMLSLLGVGLQPYAEPVMTQPHTTVRIVNKTGWRLHVSIYPETCPGPFVIEPGETYDLAVDAGHYRMTVSSQCGGTTERFYIGNGDVRVFTYSCCENRLVPEYTP